MAGFFMGKATEDGMYLWATRVLVLVSFGAHLTMALFAGIRRRRDSGLRRSLVCLAYWLTEIATPVPLGMVFLDTVIAHSEQQLKLFAFWAPFLLLHLGRPDNITSYAWENKKLSPPQIAGPLLATIGAIYGSYKQRFMRGDGALCAAFFIMLFLGSYKYAERAVVLHRASFADIRRSNKRKKLRQDGDNAQFGVHGILVVKPGGDYQRPYSGWKDMSKFVEMEASHMYNMLYTKASVIHTWYGYTIRVLSPLATATALYLFHSKEGQTMESTDRVVTYILLVGTLVLDVIWLLIALGSAWTYAFLADREQAEEEKSLLPIRRTIPDNSRWPGQLKKAGHQSGRQSWYWLRLLISLDPSRLSWRSGPTRIGIGFSAKRKKRIGIGHWLLSGVGQCNLLHECSTPQVKREEIDVRDVLFEVVCEYLEMDRISKNNNAATRRELGDYMRDNARICSLERNIIALHVATDIFLLYEPPLQNKSLLSHKYETQIRVISDYMMFLLAQRQHMVLPPGDEASEYKRVHLDLTDIWRGRKFKGEHTGRYDLDMMVHKMGIQYLDNRVDLGMALLKMDETDCNNPEANLLSEKNDTLALGAEWALKLLYQLDPKRFGFPPRTRSQVQSVCSLEDFILVFSDEAQDKIKHYRDGLLPVYLMDYMFRLILVSWIRLLIFTSNQCSRDSHAKQLSRGTELLTIVWLMNRHKENGESIDYV